MCPYMRWLLVALLALGIRQCSSDSSGLQATIPNNLIDCYKNATLRTRENLPPMTLNVLLAILRKLEGLTGSYTDMRTFSSQVMNTYRMDGIEKNPDVALSDYVIPYGPSGNEFYRYKLLMDALIPNSGSTFSNTSIKPQEKCAIHLMLSDSVDRTERGDESRVCNSLTNYVRWDSRVPRDVRGYEDEVEVLSQGPAEYRGPSYGSWLEGGYNTGLSCPLENGVVYTRYGAVKFGLVLGGVAAGLQSQSVTRNSLMLVAKANSLRKRPFKLPRLYSTDNITTTNISNIWAASLSGELAEVAILQGPLKNSQIRVGVNGGWNDSVLPRYYFLQEDNLDAMTDSDIRGSVDGLLLGSNAQAWNTEVGGSGYMKLSQLLDMYYSERGVLSSSVRACSRITLFTANYSTDDIYQQSYAFSGVLGNDLPTAVNVEDAGLQNFNAIATENFVSYFASMSDNQCSYTSTTYTNSQSSGTVTSYVSPAVHLYLVIDFNYDYLVASRVASQLAERLEVSRFTGNISIINAKDASVIVNSTNDVLDFYGNFTRSKYNAGQKGFDLARIMKDVGSLLQARLDLDSELNTAGGPASVVLMMPYSTATVSDSDSEYIYNRILELSQTVPDTRFAYLTTGARERFTVYVRNSSDVFTLSTSDIPASIDNVVANLIYTPRRIINPACGSNFTSGTTTSDLSLTAYIEPTGGVQYYRIHPNYFYKTSSGTITISSSTGRTLNICQSRVNVLPGNNSQYDTCQQISTSSYTLNINNACSSSITNCAPFYFSVAVVASSSTTTTSTCTDDSCRYPDNIQVSITQNGLTCASGALETLRKSNLIIIITLILLPRISEIFS